MGHWNVDFLLKSQGVIKKMINLNVKIKTFIQERAIDLKILGKSMIDYVFFPFQKLP